MANTIHSDAGLSTEFENQCLSIGREFLPAVAVKVLDGIELTDREQAEYQRWLESQLDAG